MSPWDVTGKHKVKNCGEKRTDGNYNANGGNKDPVSKTLSFLVYRIPDDGQSPETQ
jgi:hypothetical protein